MYEHVVKRTESHIAHQCQPGMNYETGRQKKLFHVIAFYLSRFFSELSVWAETHPNSLWNLLAFIEGYPLKKFNPCKDVSCEKLKYSSKCILSLKKLKVLTEVIILSEQILQLQVILNIVDIIKLW